jgi:regulatory protein
MGNRKISQLKSSETLTPERAYQYALRLLAGRDYASSKLRGKLAARDISEKDVEATILRLQGEGWLDDRRYAERFAESALSTGRFYGPRLRMEMRRRGVPADLVDEILKRVLEEHDEVDELRLIIDRRYPGFVFSDAGDKEKRRVITWLQRRGFGISLVVQALRGRVKSSV